MKLTIWDLIKYIYKHKLLILITVVCAFAASELYVKQIQTYSAEAIIRYKDSCVSEGLALDGSRFDANEIVAPKVIANANKDLMFNVTDDGIRANTKIIPIIPTAEQNLKTAKEKLGEQYEYHPNVFKIQYRGNGSYYETRDTLDKLIDNYFEYYNEKYLYLASVSEIDYNLNAGDFDYLEQAEILQKNIDNTIEILQGYVTNNEYRSPTTGLTFNDLINEFEYLSEFKLPLIFSRIYAARLSNNKNLLINKYTERKQQSELINKNCGEKALLAKNEMDSYVKANVDVPNSYNSNKAEGDDNVTIIQDIDNEQMRIQAQTTYDSLIKNYVTDSIEANNSLIDAKYCDDVIKIFSTPADVSINYAEYEQLVKKDISSSLDSLKELYQTAFSLIDDYNAYVPSMHIECLTGVRHYENVYKSMYDLIAVILGFVIACMLAIVIEVMKRYAEMQKEDDDENAEELIQSDKSAPLLTESISED